MSCGRRGRRSSIRRNSRPSKGSTAARAGSSPAAIAGYPIVNVPMGDSFGLPVGLSFFGTAWSEPTLIKLASGFEAAAKARKKPQFLPTLPTDVAAKLQRGKGPKKKAAPTAPAVAGL